MRNLVIIALVFELFIALSGTAVAAERPNTLSIITDDHALKSISAHGGAFAKIAPTPNLDRIASEGMLFDQCLVRNSINDPMELKSRYSDPEYAPTISDFGARDWNDSASNTKSRAEAWHEQRQPPRQQATDATH